MFPNDNNLILEIPKMKYATRLNYWRKGFWVDSILNVREVKGMSDQYLLAVFHLIEKQAQKRQAELIMKRMGKVPSLQEIIREHPFVPHLFLEVLNRGVHLAWTGQFGLTSKDDFQTLRAELEKDIAYHLWKSQQNKHGYEYEYDELDPDPIDIGELI